MFVIFLGYECVSLRIGTPAGITHIHSLSVSLHKYPSAGITHLHFEYVSLHIRTSAGITHVQRTPGFPQVGHVL